MADAPLQYFTGQQALSLRAIDVNTRHIAELERRLTQYVGPDMPRFSREGLAFFTPEGAPTLPEGTIEPGPAAKEDTLWAPGILERIAFTEVYDAPCLQEGVAYIPLATQRMSETAEGVTMTAMPGAVRSVAFLDGLSEPLIDKGQVQLPLAQSYAADDELQEHTTVVGGVRGVNWGEAWEVRDGTVYVSTATTAATDAEGNTTPAIPGVLSGVVVVPELPAPAIVAGELRLPLADHDSAAGRFDVPGLIKSVEIDEALQKGGTPRISAGVLRLPPMFVAPADMPNQVTGSINSLSCEGTEWTIRQGVIHIPRAQHDPEGGALSVPGVICGVEWDTNAGRSAPSIWQGVLRIPVPDVTDQMLTHCKVEDTTESAGWVSGTTLHLHLADDSSAGLAPRAGLLAGVQTSTTVTAPSLRGGILTLPASPSFPKGLYDAVNNQKITWEQFLSGNSVVPLSGPIDGMRICAFHLGGYLTFFVEKVAG